MNYYGEKHALAEAVKIASRSPCIKSQRGVVVFRRGHGPIAVGCNAPPSPFMCGRNADCTANCNKLCVHAEQAALLEAECFQYEGHELELLHVKVVRGDAVPSGPPSCWQCSRLILQRKIGRVWLLYDQGHDHGLVSYTLVSYTAEAFHDITLQVCNLPIFRKDP